MLQALSLFALLAASRFASAHFLLDFPGTAGFDDDNEGIAPCGGFTVDFTKNVTAFHVDGDTVALTSIHPAAQWLFRATLDTTASGNWTNLLPVIAQDALGDFCETNVQVPTAWAGSQGVIQIIQDAVDGILYQCAAVNFTAGAAGSIPSSCKNVTGLTASFTTDAALSTIPATSSPTSASASGSSSSASSAAASKAAAASTYASHDILGALFWVGMAVLGVATALVSL